MRTWRVLLRIPFLVLALIVAFAPPVAATSTPSAPENIRLSVSGSNRLDLRFDPPSDNGGARVFAYRVRISGQVYDVGNNRDLEIRNVPNGTYRVDVSARNREGWGDWGSSNQVRLGPAPTTTTTRPPTTRPPTTSPPTTAPATTSKPQSAPGAVRGLQVSMQDGDIVLRWNPPSKGDVTGYVVRVAPNFERRLPASERSTTLQGFNPGSYEIFVSALSRSGEGPSVTGRASVDGPRKPPAQRVGPFSNVDRFVEQQYLDLFSRRADNSGRQFWAGELSSGGGNAPAVIDAMMGAPEFAPSHQAIRLYLAYFNRLPDNEGLNYWVDVLKRNGASLADVSEAFAASAEFNGTYGALSDEEFVALVYNNVLARRPDAGGFAYWVNQLNRGLARGEMMVAFSDSAEFVRNSNPAVQTTAIHNSMLDRSPTPAEFQKWLARIGADPGDRLDLINQIFTSRDYASRITP